VNTNSVALDDELSRFSCAIPAVLPSPDLTRCSASHRRRPHSQSRVAMTDWRRAERIVQLRRVATRGLETVT